MQPGAQTTRNQPSPRKLYAVGNGTLSGIQHSARRRRPLASARLPREPGTWVTVEGRFISLPDLLVRAPGHGLHQLVHEALDLLGLPTTESGTEMGSVPPLNLAGLCSAACLQRVLVDLAPQLLRHAALFGGCVLTLLKESVDETHPQRDPQLAVALLEAGALDRAAEMLDLLCLHSNDEEEPGAHPAATSAQPSETLQPLRLWSRLTVSLLRTCRLQSLRCVGDSLPRFLGRTGLLAVCTHGLLSTRGSPWRLECIVTVAAELLFNLGTGASVPESSASPDSPSSKDHLDLTRELLLRQAEAMTTLSSLGGMPHVFVNTSGQLTRALTEAGWSCVKRLRRRHRSQQNWRRVGVQRPPSEDASYAVDKRLLWHLLSLILLQIETSESTNVPWPLFLVKQQPRDLAGWLQNLDADLYGLLVATRQEAIGRDGPLLSVTQQLLTQVPRPAEQWRTPDNIPDTVQTVSPSIRPRPRRQSSLARRLGHPGSTPPPSPPPPHQSNTRRSRGSRGGRRRRSRSKSFHFSPGAKLPHYAQPGAWRVASHPRFRSKATTA